MLGILGKNAEQEKTMSWGQKDVTMNNPVAKMLEDNPIKIFDVVISSLIEQRVMSERAGVANMVFDAWLYIKEAHPKEYDALIKADKACILSSMLDYLHGLQEDLDNMIKDKLNLKKK